MGNRARSRATRLVLLATLASATGIVELAIVASRASSASTEPVASACDPVIAPLEGAITGDVELVSPDACDRARACVAAPVVAKRPFAQRPYAWGADGSRCVPDERCGVLHVEAVDALDGGPLADLRVRALCGLRVAERCATRNVSELDLRLDTGTFEVLVTSKGREPVVLAPIAITRGERVDVGPIALHAGTGRVAGTVRGDLGDGERFVELLGDGRAPCDRCDPRTSGFSCTACGFAADRSRVRIGADGAFAFGRLASGAYTLRLVDAVGRTLGAPRGIVLAPSGVACVAFDSPSMRDVELALIDADGAELTSELARRVRPSENEVVDEARPSTIEVDDWKGTFERNGDAVARARFDVPLRTQCVRWGTARFCCGRSMTPANDERTLTQPEPLVPEPRAPVVPIEELVGRITDEGRVRFTRVPSWELTLRMTSGSYVIEVAIPASKDDVRVEATIRIAGAATTFRELLALRDPLP